MGRRGFRLPTLEGKPRGHKNVLTLPGWPSRRKCTRAFLNSMLTAMKLLMGEPPENQPL
jgi:hypothetical protein